MAQSFDGSGTQKILMIDNYDSFTFNLVQGFAALGASIEVYRNDEIDVPTAQQLGVTHVVISPGPGRPSGAGVSIPIIAAFAGRLPILGVCLGHQCLIEYYGGQIVSAQRLMHGKTSPVRHDEQGLFAGIENPMTVGRYHSLCAELADLPAALIASARTQEGELMAVRHRELALTGVQFHPESVLTPDGQLLMDNFLRMTV